MPKVREVLKQLRVETAGRRRKCHRNDSHSIGRGERCLAVYDPITSGRKNYCTECARPILDQARRDLHRLEEELYDSPAPTPSAADRAQDPA